MKNIYYFKNVYAMKPTKFYVLKNRSIEKDTLHVVIKVRYKYVHK